MMSHLKYLRIQFNFVNVVVAWQAEEDLSGEEERRKGNSSMEYTYTHIEWESIVDKDVITK